MTSRRRAFDFLWCLFDLAEVNIGMRADDLDDRLLRAAGSLVFDWIDAYEATEAVAIVARDEVGDFF